MNRKERRQKAQDQYQYSELEDVSTPDIPLAYPDTSGPKGKTLLDIAAERHPGLVNEDTETETITINAFAEEEDPLGAFGQALFLASTLSMLHFTLDVLVYHQYRQNIEWLEITKRTAIVLPQLLFVAYLAHTKSVSRHPIAKQIFFVTVTIASGCYLIMSTNEYGYFAVMKRAPPVGTLMIWSVIETDLMFALPSLAVVAVYLWYSGYTMF
ncbi:MAG: hypothetical protein M1820_003352 [Bogoriella megaspora]|nr:MAG: hypothetical protein M1820_003352 [Bogoriella megaspora]